MTNLMYWIVPALAILAFLGMALLLLPAPVLTGRLIRASNVAQEFTQRLARKRRVSRTTLGLYAFGGILVGLIVGLILSAFIDPLQALLVGVTLAALAGFYPMSRYQDSWDKKWVEEVNADTLRLLRFVYVLSGVGNQPIDEAMRFFAHTWSQRSELARVLMECPGQVGPVDFLHQMEIPGRPLATLLMSLQQAKNASPSQRERILEQSLHMGLSDMRNALADLGKRRVLMSIIISVLILLPALLVTVLGPPLTQLFGVGGL